MLTLQKQDRIHVRGAGTDTTPEQDEFLFALGEYVTRKGFKTAAFMNPTDWHDFILDAGYEKCK